jgi:hypothetical protein
VKLDILRCNVVHLPFRYRKLREYVGCYSLGIRSEPAVSNHVENLRSLAMKVPTLVNVLFVTMTVVVRMTMRVVVRMPVIMTMIVMIVVVFMLTMVMMMIIAFDDHVELHRAEIRSCDTRRAVSSYPSTGSFFSSVLR